MLFQEAKHHLESGSYPTTGSDLVLDDYPEYCTSVRDLKDSQRLALNQLASTVYASLFTFTPVRVIFVIGHADRALRVLPPKRSQFELEVSQHRATSVRDILEQEIGARAGNAAVNCMVVTIAKGVGSRHLRVAHASTEAEMRKNRRVEIFVAREGTARPVCACAG
jgi:flagellar motor protein MotB